VSHCWHLLGLPPDRQIRLAAFKQLQDAGDAPFKAQIAMIDAQIAALEASPTAPVPSWLRLSRSQLGSGLF
jgi:hypothetical protein